MEKYKKYKCFDFASNQEFIDHVHHPDKEYEAFLLKLIKLYPEKEHEINTARLIVQAMKFKENELDEADHKKLWIRVEADVFKSNIKFIRRISLWAACAASLIISFMVLQKYYSVHAPIDSLIQFAEATGSDSLYKNDVQVIFSDHTNYTIESDEADIQYDDQGKLMVNFNSVATQQAEEKDQNELKFDQVVVPWGKRTTITFADGSKVWLNSGSRAVYPVKFSKNSREIYIEGEAYCEVSPDAAKPFYVKTGRIEVKVLGTSFNINAYSKEMDLIVALVTGSVSISNKDGKETMLEPGQMIQINKNTQEQQIKKVDVYDYISWKDGFLQFKSEPLQNVLNRIERHFAIPVILMDLPGSYYISGKLDLKENVIEVLDVVKKLVPVQYEIKENEILITNR